MVIDIHSRVVRTTPVDTGWARANWVPSIGVPVTEPIGTPEQLNEAAAQAGIVQVAQWRFIQGPAYISNNVPYIVFLNAGSSRQAPSGFVERAVQAAVATRDRKRLG